MKITKKDLDKNNFYKKDSLDLNENIESEENLGTIHFKKSIKTTKGIYLSTGSGIKAGWGIKAGDGIKAGWGIEAGDGIKAGWGIEAGWGIKAGDGIITFFEDLSAKFISCLRICVGFHSKEERIIEGEIRKGEVIFGKIKGEKLKC